MNYLYPWSSYLNLTGGSGADNFFFDSANDGTDTITDFNVVDDSILINGSNFGNLPVGVLSADSFVTGTSANSATQRFVYNSSTGNLSYYSDGSGSNAPVSIAILSSNLALTNQDIIVF